MDRQDARRGRRRVLLAGALAALVVAVVAVVALEARGDDSPPAAGGVDRVTYLTGLGSFGREAYAWVAQENGFFAAEGIEATIQAGAAGDKNLALVGAGRAQFAVIDYSGALVRAGKGSFGDFRLIAGLNPQTLIAVMTLDDRNISQPSDLEGRTLTVATGSVPGSLFPMYAKLAGIDPARVTVRQVAPNLLVPMLASGKTDAIGQFVVGTPAIEAAAKGRKAVVLPYSQWVGDLYGNSLVTSTKLLHERPGLAERFTRALVRALLWSVEHPDEAAAILAKAVPPTNVEAAAAELRLLKPYVYAEDGAPVGAFAPQRVAKGIAAMKAAGQIPATSNVQPEDIVTFGIVTAGKGQQ